MRGPAAHPLQLCSPPDPVLANFWTSPGQVCRIALGPQVVTLAVTTAVAMKCDCSPSGYKEVEYISSPLDFGFGHYGGLDMSKALKSACQIRLAHLNLCHLWEKTWLVLGG